MIIKNRIIFLAVGEYVKLLCLFYKGLKNLICDAIFSKLNYYVNSYGYPQACPWEWDSHRMGWDGTAHIFISHGRVAMS